MADTLDAMTSDRPYRKATTFENAMAEVQRCSGSQFDPQVVRAFTDIGVEGLRKIRLDMAKARAAPQDVLRAADVAEAALDGALKKLPEPTGVPLPLPPQP